MEQESWRLTIWYGRLTGWGELQSGTANVRMSEREDQGEAFPQNAVQEAKEIRYTKEMLKNVEDRPTILLKHRLYALKKKLTQKNWESKRSTLKRKYKVDC